VPLQVTVYVVVVDGVTETLPLVAVPVEKFVPVQLEVLEELQVIVVELPVVMLVDPAETVADGG
jgi:hypothetical protein